MGSLEAKGTGARWAPQTHTWEADPSASFSGTLRFTHVYIKQNGRWLLAALHNAVPFSPVTAQQGQTPQAAQDAPESRFVALTNEWTAAINRKDRTKLDELMSPEYALYAWNGKLLAPRPVWLDNLFSHITIEANTLTDLAPRIYGDFAIVTSKGDWIGVFDNRHFKQKCIVVDTWRLLKGQWKVVARTSDCTDQ